MAQADFLGLVDKLQNAIQVSAAAEKKALQEILRLCKVYFDAAVNSKMKAEAEKKHHNQREDDGKGTVYCTDCSNRDFDS